MHTWFWLLPARTFSITIAKKLKKPKILWGIKMWNQIDEIWPQSKRIVHFRSKTDQPDFAVFTQITTFPSRGSQSRGQAITNWVPKAVFSICRHVDSIKCICLVFLVPKHWFFLSSRISVAKRETLRSDPKRSKVLFYLLRCTLSNLNSTSMNTFCSWDLKEKTLCADCWVSGSEKWEFAWRLQNHACRFSTENGR